MGNKTLFKSHFRKEFSVSRTAEQKVRKFHRSNKKQNDENRFQNRPIGFVDHEISSRSTENHFRRFPRNFHRRFVQSVATRIENSLFSAADNFETKSGSQNDDRTIDRFLFVFFYFQIDRDGNVNLLEKSLSVVKQCDHRLPEFWSCLNEFCHSISPTISEIDFANIFTPVIFLTVAS